MAAVLPLRFRILHLVNLADGKALTTDEIYNSLYDEYAGEGQFSLELMEGHLMSVKATGLIEGVEPYLDEVGEAHYKYRITATGRDRTKFLPKRL
jgi:hypothetical protein